MPLIFGRIEIDCLVIFGAQPHFNVKKPKMMSCKVMFGWWLNIEI